MAAPRAQLTHDDLRLKIEVRRARLDGVDYRVLTPATPPRNAALYDTSRGSRGYDMYVDRLDGRRVGTLFLLAARSPRSLVHLPLRRSPLAPDVGWEGERPIDLVLVPRAQQFRASRWKRLRERITAGNVEREPRTARVPLGDLALDTEAPDWAWRKGDPRYQLRQHHVAETLLLTSGPMGFQEAAKEFFAVTRDGPPYVATRHYIPGGCNYHVCRCLYHFEEIGPDSDWEQFHVEYCPSWSR
ncbi:hypothetical protein E0L36_26075 [Streptomyces sp. AJS327]|uniref:hypothetical protein n=1 Tax=Streptomyces sp. AJS327 TaxID=2545265 RepID=UPI0015DE0673|nr:hypothetical protein [Streptomyces sp. AJS327]MBA0054194.1 hypothetical protein [Streptomyces sp. AJS327]